MEAVGRQRTLSAYHLDMLADVPLTDTGMPVMDGCDVIPDDMVGFNYATGRRTPRTQGVHFYIDDYQFERVWRDPIRYARILDGYQCTLTPDFSLYTDMPMPMQCWNCYRSRLLGAYWQQLGLHVIPTLQWSTPESYAFCFDGLPCGATLSVSTVGTLNHGESRILWEQGMREAIDRLHPTLILLYGAEPKNFDWGTASHIRYENHTIERMKKWADAEHHRHGQDQETGEQEEVC